MLNKDNFRIVVLSVLILGLFILTIIIIKPIIFSIIYGVLLAYIFYPIYRRILAKIKNENLSALIVCIGLLIFLIAVFMIILGSFLKQGINLYLSLQKVNMFDSIKTILPDFLSSKFSIDIANSLNTFISNLIANSITSLGKFILDLPTILLQLFVITFIFFYSLRDGKKWVGYIRLFSLLERETEEKFFKQFNDITYSVLIGEIVVGIFQGLVAGIGYFVFGVPNPILLTLLTIAVSIFPVIGPWMVWVPVDIYLFANGETEAGLGLLIYGLVIISWLDTFIRSWIISKRAQINSAIVIIGMIGGVLSLGILGFIIGPLALAYILLILELYRKKTFGEDILFKKID